ncbi:hypothetical protein B0H11DRAFT_1909288 [Mycena galericulata]|nr:hypothetical protein B0H11DRAFT_1909288 [Mycena galericulata]
MAHNPDNNNGSDPNFVTDPPLPPDPDFIPNPHYDPRYDNIHFDPRYDRAPEPPEARRAEDAWQLYADPEQHVDQMLELRAVQAQLNVLTRNYEILARTHEHLVDYYAEATGDLSAAMRRIARLQRDLSEARGETVATRVIPMFHHTSPADVPESAQMHMSFNGLGVQEAHGESGLRVNYENSSNKWLSPSFSLSLLLSIALFLDSWLLLGMADETDSDSDNEGLAQTFEPPSQTATREELYNVVKDLQLTTGRLMVENRDLCAQVSALKASGKKPVEKGRNPLNYQAVIITLGKKFGFMHEPWINLAAFTVLPPNPPPEGTPEAIEEIFKPPDLYLQHVTSSLYGHVPSKYHELLDSEKFTGFGEDLSLLKQLPALRCMLFGAASIKNKGTGRPQAGTLGYKWKLGELTVGSLCFTLIVVLRIISEVDAVFEATGKISKIPFQAYFYKYKKMLLKNAKTPGVRNILNTWNKIVFAGVSTVTATVTSINGDGADDDLDEVAMEAEFAAAMEEMTLGNDDDDDHDLGNEDGGLSGNSDDGDARIVQPAGVIPGSGQSVQAAPNDEGNNLGLQGPPGRDEGHGQEGRVGAQVAVQGRRRGRKAAAAVVQVEADEPPAAGPVQRKTRARTTK